MGSRGLCAVARAGNVSRDRAVPVSFESGAFDIPFDAIEAFSPAGSLRPSWGPLVLNGVEPGAQKAIAVAIFGHRIQSQTG